jgi:DNA-directed RNA polymerase specialized sigma24 family protein
MPSFNGGPVTQCGFFSHEQIAELLGVTRTRVYQIERRAMAKLKKAMLADPVIREAARELARQAVNGG